MIALFSGGIDSTAAVLLNHGAVTNLLHVQYGQRHAKSEATHAAIMANYLDRPLQVIEIPQLQRAGDTIIGRNLVLIALAAAFAGDDRRVLVGCCQADAEAYPDCRPEFLTNAGIAADAEVVAPLLYKPKSFAFEVLYRAGIPHHDTHTCYVDDHKTRHDWGYGCGECGSCKVRADGWTLP